MGEDEQIREVRRIFSTVTPVYDILNHVLSLGEDLRWRRFMASCQRPGPTGRILDVATGTGDLAMALAKGGGRPMVVGLDLVPAMLGPAKKKAAQSPGRVSLMAGDGTRLPFGDNCFDAVTIAFGIRNIPRRGAALAEMLRVLAPGGRLYVLEFTTPSGSLVRGLYNIYLKRLLPLLGGLVSGDRSSYEYLARTIMEFPSPGDFRAEMSAAGFADARSYPLTRQIAWVHIGDKPA